jgi:hypothetical protein
VTEQRHKVRGKIIKGRTQFHISCFGCAAHTKEKILLNTKTAPVGLNAAVKMFRDGDL